MPEKRERAKKFYVSTTDIQYSLVVVAKNEADAAQQWAHRYNRSSSEAVVRPIGAYGTQANQLEAGAPGDTQKKSRKKHSASTL